MKPLTLTMKPGSWVYGPSNWERPMWAHSEIELDFMIYLNLNPNPCPTGNEFEGRTLCTQ